MSGLGLERMMTHVGAFGQDAGHLEEIVLARERLRREHIVVADGAFGAVDADIESVGHADVEGRRGPADLAVAKLHVHGDRAGVLDGVLRLHLVGAHLLGLVAREPSHRIDRVTAAGEDGGTAVLAAAQPLLFRRHPDPVHVVHLDHEDVAQCALLDQTVDRHQQGVPVQHEAHDGLDVARSDRLPLLLHVLDGQRDGFLDDDVLAGLSRRDNVRRVRIVRRTHDHGMNVLHAEHRGRVGLDRALEPVPVAVPLGVGPVAADQRADLGPIIRLERLHVLLRHRPTANDPDTKLLHVPTPFCPSGPAR